MPRRRPGGESVALVVSGLLIGVAGIGASRPATSAAAPPSTSPFEPTVIEWTARGGDIEDGWLDVPIDYSDPGRGMFRLHLVRHRAVDDSSRIGSLLVNPGGPGFAGTFLAETAPTIYDEDVVASFDIVAWDPRGTGSSEPFIDCIDDYDDYADTDATPDDEREHQRLIEAARDFAQRCADNNADILPFIGTNSSARDIDTIRAALGEEEISYFGFSYGSELGATWATLYPGTVRAAVFDGAVDPTIERTDRLLEEAAAFDAALASFLADCSARASCAFADAGDAEGAFDELMSLIDEAPLPTTPDRPPLTLGMALVGIVEAMYSRAFWPQLEQALAAAKAGDGAPLLSLYDAYYQRQADGSWDNSLEAYRAITCMDSAERLTIDEEDAATQRFASVAPRLGAALHEPYACTFFPRSTDPRIDISGRGAGPIVVCGVAGDPATPLHGARVMADTLEDGRLVVVEADQHLCAGVDACADAVIEDYLLDLVVPPKETRC